MTEKELAKAVEESDMESEEKAEILEILVAMDKRLKVEQEAWAFVAKENK